MWSGTEGPSSASEQSGRDVQWALSLNKTLNSKMAPYLRSCKVGIKRVRLQAFGRASESCCGPEASTDPPVGFFTDTPLMAFFCTFRLFQKMEILLLLSVLGLVAAAPSSHQPRSDSGEGRSSFSSNSGVVAFVLNWFVSNVLPARRKSANLSYSLIPIGFVRVLLVLIVHFKSKLILYQFSDYLEKIT